MNFSGCTALIQAHGRSQISQLVLNSNCQHEIVSIAQDGCIKVWNCQNLSLVRSARIKTGYLTSLINYENGFLVGTGKGQLIKFSNDLKVEWTRKIHADCVTDILETDQQLLTVSFDGKLIMMAKPDLRKNNQINLEVPLSKIYKMGDWVMISGNPSFRVNLNNLEVSQLERSEQILEFENKTLVCSEENGFSVLQEQGSTDYVPCQFMMPFKNQILAVSEEHIGEVTFDAEDEPKFKCHKVSQLKKGYSIKAGVEYRDSVFLGGEDGNIYKVQWKAQH